MAKTKTAEPAPQMATVPVINAPDLHGTGPAVDAAAARLFPSAAFPYPDAVAPAATKALSDGADEPEGTDEVEEGTETEAPESDDLDYDALAKVAADREAAHAAKAREREATQTSAQSESEAAAFRQLKALAATDPAALLRALNLDPATLVEMPPTTAPARGSAPTMEALVSKIASLETTITEMREGVTETFTQVEQTRAAQQNRREFVALTEDQEQYPLLSSEPAETRLKHTADAVRVLQGAGKAVTHASVAKVIESRLRADFEKKARALGHDLTASEVSVRTDQQRRAGKTPSATSITSDLAAAPRTARPKSELERNRAAAELVNRLFGKTLSATP